MSNPENKINLFEKERKGTENPKEKFEYYQNLVLTLPSDYEIDKVVDEVEITDFYDPVNRVRNIKEMCIDNPGMIEKTGTNRLIDLGAGNPLLKTPYDQLALESIGIKEYIAVDLNIKDLELQEIKPHEDDVEYYKKRWGGNYVEPPTGERLRIKAMKQELLTALHSFPEDYGNVWMTGLEGGLIVRNYEKWAFAVLAELKRVVPENGFIVTDHGVLGIVLNKCIPEFQEVIGTVRQISGNFNRPSKDEEQKIKESLKENEVKKDDPFHGVAEYVIDAPEIGFKVYLNEMSSWRSTIILVNTKKIK